MYYTPIQAAIDEMLASPPVDPEVWRRKPETILNSMCDNLKWKPPPGKRKRRRRRTIKTLH